jgi:cell division protein FtsI/penicillin-binding protein 2
MRKRFKSNRKENFIRFHFVRYSVLIAFILITVRLGLISIAPMISDKTNLQDVINISRYIERWHRAETKEYERGIILDRNHKKLAFSVKTFSLAANPQLIQQESKSDIARIISNHSSESFENIYERLNSNRRFVWILRKISNDKYSEIYPEIKKFFRHGVIINEEYKRIYPSSYVFSNILGFTGKDNEGLEGIELYFNKILSEPGAPITRTADGVYKEEDRIVEDFNTSNVILTIDKNIQNIVYEELKSVVEEYEAKRAMCIIINPKTGEIISMVRYPGFDNVNLSAQDNRRNWLVTDIYEPGSTLKIISVASLLQELNIDLNRTVNDPSFVTIYNHTYHNSDKAVMGNINLSQAFIKSSNVGIIQFMKPLPKNAFYSYLRNFGFGIVSGVELPGESSGLLRPARRWSGLTKFSVSIGQEIGVTPLQLIMGLSAIPNNGILLKPTIIKRITDANGKIIHEQSSIAIRQVLTTEVNNIMKDFMLKVVEEGTGRRAQIPGIKVAGKTGTAQKAIRGEYSREKYIASFYGYFPADNPEYSMLIIIDEPDYRKQIYGGAVAAPVFSKIGTKILEYHQKIDTNNIIYKKYQVSQRNRNNNAHFSDNSNLADLSGMSLRNALKYLSYHNINAEVSGKGYVNSQFPAAGVKLDDVKLVVLKLEE